MDKAFVHATAIVDRAVIGAGTRVWAYAHILPGAIVGRDCNVGDHVFIEMGAVVGDQVTIKNHVCIWEGVTLGSGVFVGPHVSFVNDIYPRSPRFHLAQFRYRSKKDWLVETSVEEGASIGANSTVIGGLRLGKYCMIAAGSTVTRDVEPFALMVGSPARQVGRVCQCGRKIENVAPFSTCPHQPIHD